MEDNYSCSLCPQVAVRCCLCSTPRIYLCPTCVLQHTSKGSSHPLVPIDTPAHVTKANLAEHDCRTTALKQVREKLEGLSTQISEEKRALDQVFNEVYNQQVQRLNEICSAVYMDIQQYYEKLQTDIETFKQELATAQQSPSMSEVVRMYVKNGFHVPQPCTFLDAYSQMTQRIQISEAGSRLCSENCLAGVISKWNKRMCDCSNCTDLQEFASTEGLNRSRSARQSCDLLLRCQICGKGEEKCFCFSLDQMDIESSVISSKAGPAHPERSPYQFKGPHQICERCQRDLKKDKYCSRCLFSFRPSDKKCYSCMSYFKGFLCVNCKNKSA